MPADEHIRQLAHEQMKVTGEPRQHAIDDLKARAGRPFPAVNSERAAFDAEVLRRLVRAGSFYWAHPFGVKGVWREPGKTVIALDHQTFGPTGREHPMTQFAMDLLPFVEPDGQVSGVIGLRVGAVRGKGKRDLELVQVDGPGHVVVRASKGTKWHEVLNDRAEGLRSEGFYPLWTERRLTADEASPSQRAARLQSPMEQEDLAWLGASLLYRINLFYAVSTAYTTSSWVNGTRWIFELEVLRRVGPPHDALLSYLDHPQWGIDPEYLYRHCNCSDVAPDREAECTFRLRPRSHQYGLLELRFKWRHPLDDGNRASFERVHAARDWLDRVLPALPPRTNPGDAFQRMLNGLMPEPDQ